MSILSKEVKLISNKGNTEGSYADKENTPDYVLDALKKGYNVKIDIWLDDGQLRLYTNKPDAKISEMFLCNQYMFLWIQCKNIESFQYLMMYKSFLNFFYNEIDNFSLTSQRYIWTKAQGSDKLGVRSVIECNSAKEYAKEIKDQSIYGVCSNNFEK
tara:strand:- start:18401 stop:18871 length:471 start_codon:yes stop_codon:yes gene_type:complete